MGIEVKRPEQSDLEGPARPCLGGLDFILRKGKSFFRREWR
jgi:hypothetical protein